MIIESAELFAAKQAALATMKPEAKKYSKRKIIEMLGDDWPKYRDQIQAAPNYAWDKWRDAQYMKEGDPDYEAFIATVPPEVVAKLDDCLWDEN